MLSSKLIASNKAAPAPSSVYWGEGWYTRISDSAVASVVDSNENIYVLSSAYTNFINKVLVSKFTPAGFLVWRKYFNFVNTANEDPTFVTIDSSNNIYWASYVSNAARVTKIDTNGNVLLAFQANNAGLGGVVGWSSVKVDASGNIYAAGRVGSLDDGRVMKFDSSGVKQWEVVYSSSYADRANAIALDSSGNVFVAGMSRNTSSDFNVRKFNNSGTQQWNQGLTSSGTNTDVAYGIGIDSSDNVYASGTITNSGVTAIAVVKYNNSGTLQWQRMLYNAYNQAQNSNSLVVDENNDIFITGQSRDATRPYAFVAKYNSSGVLQWQNQLYRSDGTNNYGRGITVDSESIYISGYYNASGSGAQTAFIVKLPKDGQTSVETWPFIYGTASLTETAGPLTSNTPIDTTSTPSATVSSLSYTVYNVTYLQPLE